MTKECRSKPGEPRALATGDSEPALKHHLRALTLAARLEIERIARLLNLLQNTYGKEAIQYEERL